jgi:hypothetical protein
MKTTTMQNYSKTGRALAMAGVAVITLWAGFGSAAQAQCGASMAAQAGVMWRNFPAEPQMERKPVDPSAAADKAAPEASGDPSIVGLWKITFTSGGQTVDQGFDVWHSDGTELLNDTPPPSTGNICVGVWAQTDRLTFKLYHPSWTFDAGGNLNGTAVIRETVMLQTNGNVFTGTFTVDEFDLNGKNIFHIAGAVKAQRITVN